MEAIWAIFTGIVVGTTARLLLLRSDYRNYPSSPNGVLIHATIGFLAAALGAVAVPALMKKDYIAVTFLSLAVQQLREVRRAERESLTDLESSELVPRGEAYIDGLAKGFESRNYVTLIVGLVTSATTFLLPGDITGRMIAGIVLGAIVFLITKRWTGHITVGDLCTVELADVRFEGADFYVGDIWIANVGLEMHRKRLAESAVGLILTPEDPAAHITLANVGQRRAIIHEVSRLVGVQRYHGTRRDFKTGRIAFYLVPMKERRETILRVVKDVPVLESIKRPEGKTFSGGGQNA